jgi:hypothetical protein
MATKTAHRRSKTASGVALTIAATRLATGRPVNGAPKTDARWSKPGTQLLDGHHHATRWAYYPQRRRAAINLSITTAVVLVTIGLLVSPASTAATLRVFGWVAIITAAWAVIEKSRRWAHRREVIATQAESLAAYLKDSRYLLDPMTWIQIPVDFQDRPSRIYLDRTLVLTTAQEKGLPKLVGNKLGLVNPTATFHMQGERPFMELRPAPLPPELVAFSDPAIRAMVDNTSDSELFIGLGPREAPVLLNLDMYPHPGMSMCTGTGKSTTARGMVTQGLHKGWLFLILDPKMDSQLWCRDLPGVRYADTPEEIHHALLWLSDELDRRNEIAKEHVDIHGNVDPALIGPRLVVIAEELNTLESDLGIYWRGIREQGDPIKPPSLIALGRAFNMGRARRIHVVPIAQELLVQCLGGPAAKANISALLLGRANTPTWNKLAPQCKVNGRYPRRMDRQGRVYVVIGDEPVAVQTMKADVEEAREYASSGTVSIFPDEGGTPGHALDHRETEGAASLPRCLTLVPPLADEGVTIAEGAVELGLEVKTLRNARDRDRRFPDPIAKPPPGKPARYHVGDLLTWAAGRPQAIREGEH